MPRLILDDVDFLRLVADEGRRTCGVGHDEEVAAAR
jgi:hypothetical protein